ncbi:hypothetical protein QFZ80_006450 [Paenibacillus sp. V4I7]|nr:hypothetical protein [Paenibacillus sp. V4I7]
MLIPLLKGILLGLSITAPVGPIGILTMFGLVAIIGLLLGEQLFF